jgi:hypothetical protein
MDVLVERVAGLDVGKEIVVVCVRTPGPGGRRVSETRTYRTMSRSLKAMADWLVESGVTLAGMESTATYWKPVFYALEDRMGSWLLNAAHLKAVPGRKSDVNRRWPTPGRSTSCAPTTWTPSTGAAPPVTITTWSAAAAGAPSRSTALPSNAGPIESPATTGFVDVSHTLEVFGTCADCAVR